MDWFPPTFLSITGKGKKWSGNHGHCRPRGDAASRRQRNEVAIKEN